jgi:hypothetical protein
MKKVLALFASLFLFASPIFAASSATCNDTDTVLMLHGEGTDASTTITDSSNSGRTMTAVGDAQIDTAQSKFGSASILLDGTGDRVTAADSADWDFGTGDFTIEAWIRFNDNTNNQAIISHGDLSTTGFYFEILGGGAGPERSFILGGSSGSGAATFNNATWYHVAFIRSGTTVTLYLDGVSKATATNSSNISGATGSLFLGALTDSSRHFNGWIDEVRVVKGRAIWTAGFTPPTSAYSDVCSTRRRILYTNTD